MKVLRGNGSLAHQFDAVSDAPDADVALDVESSETMTLRVKFHAHALGVKILERKLAEFPGVGHAQIHEGNARDRFIAQFQGRAHRRSFLENIETGEMPAWLAAPAPRLCLREERFAQSFTAVL